MTSTKADSQGKCNQRHDEYFQGANGAINRLYINPTYTEHSQLFSTPCVYVCSCVCNCKMRSLCVCHIVVVVEVYCLVKLCKWLLQCHASLILKTTQNRTVMDLESASIVHTQFSIHFSSKTARHNQYIINMSSTSTTVPCTCALVSGLQEASSLSSLNRQTNSASVLAPLGVTSPASVAGL